jgi:succinate-semialdehyde dehydrogenase/glutarate-semialdehyde dehydrogenase/succinyl-CoA reductase
MWILDLLVNTKALENIESFMNDMIKDGAELLTGGVRAKDKGYFYKPAIFRNVSPKMCVAQEESFSPIAPIIVVDDEIEAIRLTNDSQFGLGASIWTQDLDKGILIKLIKFQG